MLSLVLLSVSLPSMLARDMSAKDTALLVSALKQYLYFDSVYLPITFRTYRQNSEFEERYGVARLMNELHNNGLSTTVYKVNVFDKDFYVRKRLLMRSAHTSSLVLIDSSVAARRLLTSWWGPLSSLLDTEDHCLWLVLLEGSTIEKYFAGINVSMSGRSLVAEHREDGVHITEVFRLPGSSSMDIHPLGRWNGTVLHWTKSSLYQRRKDMRGILLHVSAEHDPPFTVLTERNQSLLRVDGIVTNIWRALEHRINFTTEFSKPFVQESLEKEERLILSSTWDKNIDAAIGDIVHGELFNLNVATFTAPFFFMKYKMFIRRPEVVELNWDSFFKPFHRHFWIAVAVFAVVACLCLTLLRRHESHSAVSDSIVVVVGALSQQGSEVNSVFNSGRILLLVVHLTAVTLLVGYSASLTSWLAARQKSLPFMTLEGLFNDRTYTFSSIRMSSNYNLKMTSDVNMWSRARYYTKYLDTMEEAIQQLCNTRLTVLLKAHRMVGPQPCDIVPLPGYVMRLEETISLKPWGPYRRILSFHMNELRRSGILHHLTRGLTHDESPAPEETQDISVSFWSVLPLLSFWAAGMIAAAVLLLLEYCWHRRRNPHCRRYRRGRLLTLCPQ